MGGEAAGLYALSHHKKVRFRLGADRARLWALETARRKLPFSGQRFLQAGESKASAVYLSFVCPVKQQSLQKPFPDGEKGAYRAGSGSCTVNE